MSAWRIAGVTAAAVAVASATEWVADSALPAAAGDAAAGAALLGAGAAALAVARGARCGVLMLVCGVVWLAGTVSGALVFLNRGPLVQLVLSYPRALPQGPVANAIIAAAYVCGVSGSLARSPAVTLLLAAALLAAALARQRASAGVERRARAAALAAALLVSVALGVPAAARAAGQSLDAPSLWVYDASVTLVAIGLAVDLRWGRWSRAAVAELVSDLGSLGALDAVRERLARAIGDPTLVLALGAAPADAVRNGRVVTILDDGGQQVAALVHDGELAVDPQLLGTAVSVARLAAASARLQGEVASAVNDVSASRRRLVEAGLEQRRRLEADLRAGAERRLAAVAGRLERVATNGGAAAELSELGASLERARDDLHRFAQGVHPRALTEQGLAAALRDVADSMPMSVRLRLPARNAPADVEATAYFLCAEALANITKHAEATSVQITISAKDGALDVTVLDDGVGGANPAGGTGLRGLADRIEALGGCFELHSPCGAGTRLHARIPL
jgi:signal transduction histidine kinase